VDLWIVGDDQASGIVHGRLKIEKPGPGFCHFPSAVHGYNSEYYRQLTAMKAVIRYVKGRPKREWVVLPGRVNEAFDCRKYSLAALYILNPDWGPLARNRQKRAERFRQDNPPPVPSRQQGLEPPQMEGIPKPAPPVSRPPKSRRPARSKWATGWRSS
jgi:phage terminase large subunit GpA-like protein